MKKIIKTISLAALMAVSTASVAQADPFKGFYIGAQAGWQHNQVKVKSHFGHGKGHTNRVLLGANFGMQTVASNGIYLAGEGNLDFALGEHNNVFRPGVSAKIGYQFTPNFVLAAKVGTVYSKVISSYHTHGCWGFAPGVEALYAVNEHNIVGMSYQYSMFKDSHWHGIKMKPTAHALTAKYAYKF